MSDATPASPSATAAAQADPQAAAIDAILSGLRSIAVVGVSDKPERASNHVTEYLIQQGFRVLPVNPSLKEIFGLPCLPGLDALPGPVDLVDVFRRSEDAGAVVDEAIACGAKAVWLQEGVRDEAAAARARAAGLLVVMDRCILKEHMRRAARA